MDENAFMQYYLIPLRMKQEPSSEYLDLMEEDDWKVTANKSRLQNHLTDDRKKRKRSGIEESEVESVVEISKQLEGLAEMNRIVAEVVAEAERKKLDAENRQQDWMNKRDLMRNIRQQKPKGKDLLISNIMQQKPKGKDLLMPNIRQQKPKRRDLLMRNIRQQNTQMRRKRSTHAKVQKGINRMKKGDYYFNTYQL